MDRNSTFSSSLFTFGNTQSPSGLGLSQPIDIFAYYEQWRDLVDRVERKIEETIHNTEPTDTNGKVFEYWKRRHQMVRNVRDGFDFEVKSQLMVRGPDAGVDILVWAQAEFLRRLNAAMLEKAPVPQGISKMAEPMSINAMLTSVKMSEGKSSGLNETASQIAPQTQTVAERESIVSFGSSSDSSRNHSRLRFPLMRFTTHADRRSANLDALKKRWAKRDENLRLKRDELRKQRLTHTNPPPVQLTQSDRERLTKRIRVIKEREQRVVDTMRSFGTIRKLVGNVGAKQEKVAELSRSMLRKGNLLKYVFNILIKKNININRCQISE